MTFIPLAVRKVAETDVNNAQTDHCNWMEGRSPRDIIAEQEKDSDLCQIIQWLKNDQVPSEFELQLCSPAAKHWWSCNSQLKFKDGILVYEWLDTVPPKLLVMVPKSMKQEVLVNCHNTKVAGHFGQQKTYNKLKSRFMWHGMRQDALIHVRTCEEPLDQLKTENTGYSPNMLMFGREVQHPVDLLMGTSHARGNNKQPSEFIRDLKQVMEEVHSIVRENIQSAQFRQKRDYDTKLFQRTYDVGDAVYRIDSATKENEDLDIMIQDPDIGHDLSVLFPDEIPDNDLTMICSGSSGNYGQITNGSPVQDVDMNNQVMDTPGSIHSPVAEAISSCPFCVTGSAGKKECEHHYRVVSDLNDSFSENDLDETFLYGVEDSDKSDFISRMASIERELEYDVREEIELEGNRTVVIMGKEMEGAG
ncbi:Hypothetical predicted protein [Mytilus galloprovincialis]|uniref:Integrase zinc-binding domain-containing protein n=1 Tax=Mytilus galloprovincialis TaxID=29158 RepID=A0A8B6G1N7_MYTGA|nr:Hypothetical predicted protein [Mytilus galloprovincialis]